MNRFVEDAMEAGFTEEQAEFLLAEMARKGHHHEIEEIDGLDEMLEDLDIEA